MSIEDIGGKKPLSFEEFFCPNLTLQQNAWIFWRILKSEKLTYFFPKEKIAQIETEEELREIYNRVLSKVASLVIDSEKIIKAQSLLEQLKFQRGRRKKVAPSFFIY